jgi:predicted aspartyl protease/tetratricopeptide (TPR) repeat protein
MNRLSPGALVRTKGTGHVPGMKTRALVCSLLLSALPHPALADDKCKVNQIAGLPVQMDGPRATVPVTINGTPTRIWLDSGAFFNFMPKARAVALGLTTEPLPIGFHVSGIGGSFTPELARVRDFGLLGTTLHNMEFVVGGSDAGNGFLGSNLLGVWDTEFDLAKGSVKLFKVSGCSRMGLAYWGAGMSVNETRLLPGLHENDHHIYLEVMVNGHSLRAMLDTGAPDTILGSHAAQRVGIDLTQPQVVASMRMGGVGSHTRKTWIARTQSIAFGGENIANSPIRVIDDSDDDRTDMIVGVDFLMAHHVLVSRTQNKMYLTYNGGPIFSASTDGAIGHMETIAQNMGAAEKTVDPKTADEFAGRGSARLTKGDAAGAIADFSEAIRLKPGSAELLNERAQAYQRNRQPDLASRDIEAALAIAPNDHRLLIWRATIRLAHGDRAGALADTNAAAAAVPPGSLDVVPVVVLYERLGQADRGPALLDPVLALHHDDSRYPRLLNARAWNRALANADLDRAQKDIDAAVRKAGPNPGMLDTRALVDLRRKAFPAAIADASAALTTQPKLATSLYFRGLAHLASGDAAAGKADIAAARAIQPAIDTRFAPYGLAAPGGSALPPAPEITPDDDD